MPHSHRQSEAGVGRQPHGYERAVRAAAIASLIADAERGAVNVIAHDEPARHIRPGWGWRARRIVQEINALRSINTLTELEQELRAVLVSQETRQWVKLSTRTLFDECNIEEVASLVASEEAQRRAMETQAARTLAPYMNVCTFMAREEAARMAIVLQYRDTVRWRGRFFQKVVLAARESDSRRGLVQQEALERAEAFRRRLVDVGQELQRELVRRNMSGLTAAASSLSANVLHARRVLQRREADDRLGLERLSLTHLSVLYCEAQAELLPALQRDVAAASAQRVAAQQRVASDALWAAKRQALVDMEARLRDMVVHAEQDEYQTAYYDYTVGWRDVHARIAAQPDLAGLLSSLELFDRRYVHDEERRAWGMLATAADEHHRAVAQRDAQLSTLLKSYARGASRIWRAEAREHAAMHAWHHTASGTAKAISAVRVLGLEEERGRLRVRGEEARAVLDLCRHAQRSRCLAEADEGRALVAALEAGAWATLQRWLQLRTAQLPLDGLIAREAATRAAIEADEYVECVELRAVKEEVVSAASLLCVTAHVVRQEWLWRELVVGQECAAARVLAVMGLLSEERHARAAVRREEWWAAQHIHREAFAVAETVARAALKARDDDGPRAHLALHEVVLREELLRHRLVAVEEERRAFLVGSAHYEQPYLAACAHDELAHRLDIIAEAELTLRACAYGAGHDSPVEYRTAELAGAEQQLRFFTLEELYAAAAGNLMTALEPAARAALEAQWWAGCVSAKIELEESVGRAQLADAALSRLTLLARHCREGAALRQGLAEPALSGDEWRDDAYGGALWSEERILHYLRHEKARITGTAASATVVCPTRPSPIATPSPLGGAITTLLVEMYLARDRLVFEEATGRRVLGVLAAHMPAPPTAIQGKSGPPSLEVHSVLVVGSSEAGGSCSDPSGRMDDPVVVTGRFGVPEGSAAAQQCCALGRERTADLLGDREHGGTTVTLYSTSPVDRVWQLDHHRLLCAPFLITLLNSRGDTLAESAFQFTPKHIRNACAVVDLRGDSPVRVKLLLHV